MAVVRRAVRCRIPGSQDVICSLWNCRSTTSHKAEALPLSANAAAGDMGGWKDWLPFVVALVIQSIVIGFLYAFIGLQSKVPTIYIFPLNAMFLFIGQGIDLPQLIRVTRSRWTSLYICTAVMMLVAVDGLLGLARRYLLILSYIAITTVVYFIIRWSLRQLSRRPNQCGRKG
jgi:hypothetical protein